MPDFTRERLSLALSQLRPEHGLEFERFANDFIAPEFPGLRSLGGLADEGRDALIYAHDARDRSFVQSSITSSWSHKIRSTLKRLHEAGHSVHELIYCSNQLIGQKSDLLRATLRKENISLDIRDREYFLTRALSSQQRITLSSALCNRHVNPLLAQHQLAEESSIALGDEEVRNALVYLELQVRDKDSAKGLTKTAFDALVLYGLRETAQGTAISEPALLDVVFRLLPDHERARVAELSRAALQRLVNKDVIKYHPREGGYLLAYPGREYLKQSVAHLAIDREQVRDEIADRAARVAHSLQIEYAFDPSQVATDVLALLHQFLFLNSASLAVSISRDAKYPGTRRSSYDLVESTINQRPRSLGAYGPLSRDQYLDLVPAVIDDVVRQVQEPSRSYLRQIADAYGLLSFLRQTPDVQAAVSKVFDYAIVYVDTSYIVPCLAEVLLPPASQRFTNLLRAARLAGTRLVFGDDVVNEIDSHLDRLTRVYFTRIAPRVGRRPVATIELTTPALITAYLNFGRDSRQLPGLHWSLSGHAGAA